MKRLQQLTPADLRNRPVWHYSGDSDDNAIVQATDRAELTGDEAGEFLAATQFVLADGSQHIGFCSALGDDDNVTSLQPVIVTDHGPVYFCFEDPPSRETLDAQWKLLGTASDEVFPVQFRCMVPVNGQYVTGTIEAEDLTGAA